LSAADAQVRLAGDEDLALGLRSERDRLGGGAGPRDDDLEIAPFAVGKGDRVARLRIQDRKSAVKGTSVSGRADIGGRRIFTEKTSNRTKLIVSHRYTN